MQHPVRGLLRRAGGAQSATRRWVERFAVLCASACAGLGCGDDCVGWTEASIDPRIRKSVVGIRIGDDGTIFSWEEELARADARLWGIAWFDSPSYHDSFTVVGAGGTIRYSVDDGETWTAPASPPVAEDLFGVVYACDKDAPYLISVGAAGRIVRSTTGGETWAPVNAPTQVALRDVAVVHPDTVVAVGDGGVILRSTDQGVTWSAVHSGTQADLRAIGLESCFSQLQTNRPVHGVVVGEGGTVLVTRDSGASWMQADLGLTRDLLQVQVRLGSSPPWKLYTTMLDSEHLWRWEGDSDPVELVRDFNAPVHWFHTGGGYNVIGEGVLYTYRSPKQCTTY